MVDLVRRLTLLSSLLAGAFLCSQAVVAGGVSPGGAAAQQQPSSSGFTDVVDVRVVNVEVVVTDRRGRRVTGLPPSAFELWVDGEQEQIAYFTEIAGGLAVAPRVDEATSADQDAAAPSPLAEVPVAVAGQPVPVNLLIFVDEVFSLAPDRDRVLDRLREQLASLGPADRVAVVRYDGELELLTSWTRDQAVLADALQRAQGRKSFGLRRFDAERSLFESQQDALFGVGGSRQRDLRLTLEERGIAQRLVDAVERIVRASSASLRSLAAPPGRRVLLLLAGGWPYSAAEYIVGDSARVVGDTDLLRGDRILAPLRDTANLLGYTIYPVDVPGLQSTLTDSRLGAFGSRSGLGPNRDPGSFTRESTLHQSLFYLAEETGGRALINARRDDVLSAPLEDTRSYYWLGFVPQRLGDDRRREVEIRLRDRSHEVRHRRDYVDYSRQREVTLAVESSLYFDTPPTTNALAVAVGRGERSGLRTMEVPIELGIPVDLVTFLPGPGGFLAQLELRVAVLDSSGATTDTPVIPLRFEVAERPAEGTMLRYDTALRLRRKPHQLVVALLDVPSGAMASSAVEIQP